MRKRAALRRRLKKYAIITLVVGGLAAWLFIPRKGSYTSGGSGDVDAVILGKLVGVGGGDHSTAAHVGQWARGATDGRRLRACFSEQGRFRIRLPRCQFGLRGCLRCRR